MRQSGNIDLDQNPFALDSWINQGYGLTKHRTKQLAQILFKSIEDI